MVGLDFQEGIDGFFEVSGEEVLVSLEGDGPGGGGGELVGEVVAVDGLKEEDGADAMVEVGGVAAEGVEFLALVEEGGDVEWGAEVGEGLVARGGVVGGDE